MTTSKRIVNYGSINIDHVYRVPHFVQPGETLTSASLSTGLGGKGANQSAAIARAGGEVSHIGQLSTADQWAKQELQAVGVSTQAIQLVDQPSGHAIIQVDDAAENAIIVHGGANQQNSLADIKAMLQANSDAAFLLLQNECNAIAEVTEIALAMGFKLVLNPAPMSAAIKDLPLNKLDTLIVNQVEAQALTGFSRLKDIERFFSLQMPDTRVVLTLGSAGARLVHREVIHEQPAFAVRAVDTTCAGDTFVGFFLAAIAAGLDNPKALKHAAAAAALTVTKLGAIAAIPNQNEVQQFLNAQTDH